MNQCKNNKNIYSVKVINSLDEISNYYGIKKSKLITYIDKNNLLNNRYIDLETTKKLLSILNLKYSIDRQLTVIEEIQKQWSENKKHINKIITVGVLGHVNHGKTTLIKKIINQQIIEDGDITQNINIYNKENIFFLDTPGHALFHFMREHILQIIDIIFLIISLEDGIAFETNRIIKMIIENNLVNITRIIFTKSDIAKYNYKDIISNLNKIGLYNIEYCIIDYSLDIMDQINKLLELNNFNSDEIFYNQLLTIRSTDKIYNLIKLNYGELTKKSCIMTNNKIYRVTGTFDLNFKPVTRITPQCFAYCTTDNNLDINNVNFVHTNNVELIELYNKYIVGKMYIQNYKSSTSEDGIYYKKKIVCIIDDIIMREIIISMAKQSNVDKIIIVVLKSEKHIISTIDSSQNTILFRVNDNSSIVKILTNNKVKYTIIDNIYQLEKYLSQNNLDIFNNINIRNIAEVVKIFEINNKKIIGCQVLKGDFKMNSKISVAKSSNINEVDESSTIISMKQDDKFIKQTKKNILFGVILSDDIKVEVGNYIYS